jgi:hypothetical protein
MDRPLSALVNPVASMANCRPRQLSQIAPRDIILLAVVRMFSFGFSMLLKFSSFIMTLHLSPTSFRFIRACTLFIQGS